MAGLRTSMAQARVRAHIALRCGWQRVVSTELGQVRLKDALYSHRNVLDPDSLQKRFQVINQNYSVKPFGC
jgi:hypothetical protein